MSRIQSGVNNDAFFFSFSLSPVPPIDRSERGARNTLLLVFYVLRKQLPFNTPKGGEMSNREGKATRIRTRNESNSRSRISKRVVRKKSLPLSTIVDIRVDIREFYSDFSFCCFLIRIYRGEKTDREKNQFTSSVFSSTDDRA